jgi:hypothetical protein
VQASTLCRNRGGKHCSKSSVKAPVQNCSKSSVKAPVQNCSSCLRRDAISRQDVVAVDGITLLWVAVLLSRASSKRRLS